MYYKGTPLNDPSFKVSHNLLFGFNDCISAPENIKFHPNNTVFWDVMLHGSCVKGRFRGTYHLHHQVKRISELGMSAVTSN
jgi:hypothetical protein